MNQRKEKGKPKKTDLYIIVGILLATSVVFRLISEYKFEQTSILFVGLPTLITLLVIRYSGTPKSAYSIVFKTITMFLLMASILLGEGTICIIMAAPLFYGTAALIIFLRELLERYYGRKSNSKTFSIIGLIIIFLAEPFGGKTNSEIISVEEFVIIENNVSLETLNEHHDFTENYPNFFKLGFPEPIKLKGDGIKVGDVRNIDFESNTKGIGTLSLEIVKRDVNTIVFDVISDDTHINHWLTWKEIKVQLIPMGKNKTKVSWTSNFVCDLGPRWYFEPLEKYAVGVMNKHLINTYFK